VYTLVKKGSGDSWTYSFSNKRLIQDTFDLLKKIYDEGGIHKKTLSTKIRNLTSDQSEPPRKFLEHLELIRPVSAVYNITEKGKRIVEMLKEGKRQDFAKEIFEMIKDRYQVARYLDKFIAAPGRLNFKKEEFKEFVIQEWLVDFGYEKDDRIDRENALTVAEWLGIIKWDDERKEYIINRRFKTKFFDTGFLSIIRELAYFRNEWSTIDLCEKLRSRYREYMSDPPSIDFILERLTELQKENPGTIEFSPGWPTPPIPPAYAVIRFNQRHIATLRAPVHWREIESLNFEKKKEEG